MFRCRTIIAERCHIIMYFSFLLFFLPSMLSTCSEAVKFNLVLGKTTYMQMSHQSKFPWTSIFFSISKSPSALLFWWKIHHTIHVKCPIHHKIAKNSYPKVDNKTMPCSIQGFLFALLFRSYDYIQVLKSLSLSWKCILLSAGRK